MAAIANNYSNQLVFKDKPDILYADEDRSVKAPPYGKIDLLMKSIDTFGPLVAVGEIGPSAYTEKPFPLKKSIDGLTIYGWKPKTFQGSLRAVSVILLGARKIKEDQDVKWRKYVYFTLALDVTENSKIMIRAYRPMTVDPKIYVMSYKNFRDRSLHDLHPICPHMQWLCSASIDALLDRETTEMNCKTIGQYLFDFYKEKTGGNSEKARDAVQRICEATRFLTRDGFARKAHIEYVWDGIGDDNWRWMR